MPDRQDFEDVRTKLARLRALADHVPAMLAYWDATERCRFANRHYVKWFGVTPEELIGRTMQELLGPIYPLNLPYIRAALDGVEQRFEREIPDPLGGPPRHSQAHYVPDVSEGVVTGFYVLVVDITHRKLAEDARLRDASARLTSLTTLASGLAHQLNSPITATLGMVESALARLEGEPANITGAVVDSVRKDLLTAQEGADHAATLLQSMRLLSAGDAARRETVDLESVVRESAAVADQGAPVLVTVADSGIHVEGDRSHLMQVFVNLFRNAFEAAVVVGVRANQVRASIRRKEQSVLVAITDDGPGIAPAILERVFDPFFTTKDVRRLGLGLPVARAVISALGGSVSIESEVGVGSTFLVTLPAAPHKTSSPLGAPASKKIPTALAGAGEGRRLRVLVVEDEPSLLNAIERFLASKFELDAVSSGVEAIALLEERDYDVVLCDLMMPFVGGDAVYRATERIRPSLLEHFVFMTGGAVTVESSAFIAEHEVLVLQKPFTFKELRETLLAVARAPSDTMNA